MKTGFQIYSLGCKVNQYDGALLKNLLINSGFSLSSQPNLVIVNTCSVTKKAIVKDRQLINKLKKQYPQAKLVVMGCWPQTDKQVEKIFKDVLVWGVGKHDDLVAKLANKFLSKEQLKKKRINKEDDFLIAPTDRSRYFLKIGDGCNQFCTYCIIPYARGRITSWSEIDVVKEAKAAIKHGYREIVLTAIHLGRYGQDLKNKKYTLVYLLQELLKLDNLGRIRLSSIEINEVDEGLIDLIKNNKKLCSHLHISLQSGSDKILKLMNRPYSGSYFKDKIKNIKSMIPEIAISTDIIVGFPGEKEEDFRDSYNLAKDFAFSKIHVFPFSAHELTPAYSMDNKVDFKIIKNRALKLRKLSDKLEADYLKMINCEYINKPLSLIKEKGGGNKIRANTEFGFDIYLNNKEADRHNFI